MMASPYGGRKQPLPGSEKNSGSGSGRKIGKGNVGTSGGKSVGGKEK